LRQWRKPLVVMTPKSLLRHKHAVSTLDDLSKGAFRRVLWDPSVSKAKRVLLCSGKVYYDLLAGREAKKRDDVAIVRFEQLYPLSDDAIAEAVRRHQGAEMVWVQEEPFNMGAWYHLNARWPKGLPKLACVSRPESASPATGSEKTHKFEQQLLVDNAFADAPLRTG
jgi:2-oxoglutarate dehydrogenase E1 component